jgi:hypothetical protein
MASIAFYPSQSGSLAVQSADFENDFNVTQNGNVFNFNGSWYCPASPAPATYTQNMICVCPQTGNCAAITATFSFSGGNGTVTGSMSVSTTTTPFSSSGIAAIATDGAPGNLFLSGSTAPNAYISAPFLLGHISENTF